MRKKILYRCVQKALKRSNPSNSQWNGFMHFAFIIVNNKIIGFGENQDGHADLRYPAHAKIHAEVNAYKKCKHLLNDKAFEIVNIRTTKQHKIKFSKPCDCCYAFLKELNCKRIWFSTNCDFASIKM